MAAKRVHNPAHSLLGVSRHLALGRKILSLRKTVHFKYGNTIPYSNAMRGDARCIQYTMYNAGSCRQYPQGFTAHGIDIIIQVRRTCRPMNRHGTHTQRHTDGNMFRIITLQDNITCTPSTHYSLHTHTI